MWWKLLAKKKRCCTVKVSLGCSWLGFFCCWMLCDWIDAGERMMKAKGVLAMMR